MAENFFLANDNKTAVSLLRINNKSGRHLLKKAHDEKQAEAFYLFTDEREKQLLIVSGDERMQRILGYTDRPLAGNAIPDGLADLLDGYTAQYNALGNAASSAATTPTRSALYNGERLLSTAAWGQWAPFNNLTPQHYHQRALALYPPERATYAIAAWPLADRFLVVCRGQKP